MKQYQQLDVSGTVFQIDGTSIPSDPANRHYAEMLEEIEAGEAEILPYAPPAKTWNKIRWERDRLMAETDWWALSDQTLSSEQSAYRQALRDVPQAFDNPDDVVWPTPPE
jgi:hypothetical protein